MPCGRASDQIEIFFHISTGNTYTIPIHSLLFLYYVGSPKVPPRVFGPLGPKTLRGQKQRGKKDNPILKLSSRVRLLT